MPKMTTKYRTAITTAHNHSLPAINTKNQEELYALLQENGYFWDSQMQTWTYHAPEAAEEPTALVMVRVWANAEIVQDVAEALKKRVPPQWQLIEQSPPYQCRPPKQREARIYLKFLPTRS